MPSIALTSLLVLLGLTTLTLGQQGEECGGPLSFIPFNNITYGFEYYSRCSFPTDKLNVSCIISSCPLLSRVCPLANQTALKAAVSILTSCLKQSGLICGLNMARIPIVEIAWTTAELIPDTLASGIAMLNPGTGYTSNIPDTTFTVSQPAGQNGSVTLVIVATNITSSSECSCNFSIPSASLLSTLRPFGPFPSALSSSLSILNTPHVTTALSINISSTVSIDLRTHPPTINTLDDHSNTFTDYKNFVTLDGINLISKVVEMFNAGMLFFLKASVVPSTALNFLSTYAALALQGAQEGCP